MCYYSTIRLQTDAYAVMQPATRARGGGKGIGRGRERGRERYRAYLTTVLLLYDKHILFDTFRTRRSDPRKKKRPPRGEKQNRLPVRFEVIFAILYFYYFFSVQKKAPFFFFWKRTRVSVRKARLKKYRKAGLSKYKAGQKKCSE